MQCKLEMLLASLSLSICVQVWQKWGQEEEDTVVAPLSKRAFSMSFPQFLSRYMQVILPCLQVSVWHHPREGPLLDECQPGFS